MRLRRLCPPVLCLPLLTIACNDNTPSYPAIIIYGKDGTAAGTSLGSGNTNNGGPSGNGSGGANASASGGSGNTPSGGASNALYAHCGTLWSGQDPPIGKVSCDLDALTDGGALSGDITADRMLEAGHSYLLKGPVRVMPGVTLTIPPCVKVIGEDSNAVLAVLAGAIGDSRCNFSTGLPTPGGKLVAVGEPMAPIVFTSAKPKGQRQPGDWGGVILMGNAQNNLVSYKNGAGTRAAIEGLTRVECFGWYTDQFNTESSGDLEYVRIEYASRQIDANNETNGLTLGALGSGTGLHYIMVSNSADDCFEWFGGAVNADHLIALNCDDDMFDGDNGFSGKLQFLFGRQFPTTTESDSRGFEIDGAPSIDLTPLTSEQVANFTVCGGGTSDHNRSRDGLVLRSYSGNVSMMNGMVTGFAGAGLFVQQDATSPNASLTFAQVWGSEAGLITQASPNNTSGVNASWFLGQTGNTPAEPDRFCDCWANPPVPVAASTGKGGTPTGFGDESANYIGAFKGPAALDNWMRGAWVDWSSE